MCASPKLSGTIISVGVALLSASSPGVANTIPGAAWEVTTPKAAGLNEAALDAFRDYLGGRGCVVRHGKMVYTWGDQSAREDVASACKPVIAHFLWKALEDKRIASLDEPILKWQPCLAELNPDLGHKDRSITFRHLATQTSCYGVSEKPGTAFNYNDWQMSLFREVLFTGVYQADIEHVDTKVLGPLLTDVLQCQDAPTFLAFGKGDRAGRLAISVRDFARFGLLYLHEGRWGEVQLLEQAHAIEAVTRPLPNSIPRTRAVQAQMCPEAKSLGSRNIPDDQTDHFGSYSYLWWTNGRDRDGRRHWPGAPVDTFGAFGHKNGQRAVVVIPSLDLVVSWNGTTLGNKPGNPVNEALTRLVAAVDSGAIVPDPDYPAWLKRERGGPFFMSGPGDPEGFLYRGEQKPDGTRDGDQMELIQKMAGTGANCIYLMAVRSHGGDGDRTHNPFIDNDPAKPLNDRVLDQWETWFSAMDRHGIVIYFFIYDDSAYPFGRRPPADGAMEQPEKDFIDGIVKRFQHHRHLIWCVAEEYAEKLSRQHAIAVAERIRAIDSRHAIAIHQNTSTQFDFKDVPIFNQFAVQWNVDTPEELHAGTLAAWKDVGGRVNINMSEFADSRYKPEHFSGTGDDLRRKIWAIAMAGGYSMMLGMDIASTPVEDLETCGRLVRFMESTPFQRTSPQGALARFDTQYVLAAPGEVYLAYALSGSRLGLLMEAGTYRVKWYDPIHDNWVDEGLRVVAAGEVAFAKPAEFGDEAALHLQKARPPARGKRASERSGGLSLENGWFVHDGRALWGYAQHNGWWRGGQRANITRNAPGQAGPNRTEDLDQLTDNMLRFAYPGFEHNFGLWYDRRRDQHDTAAREDANALGPFLEQPWARSETGRAWDGLPKYDLMKYNDWYFDRLREFASLCDRKGTILLHNFYMQHALLEMDAHYVDFPWRPVNCIQATDLPDNVPAANAFYDVSHPVRRQAHQAYIRKCLDELGTYTNVVHLLSQEYTGPTEFARFWLETIGEWQRDRGRTVLVALGGCKDVLDALADDPRVSALDLRYWWYQPDGTLHAPPGGRQVPGRYALGADSSRTTPASIYRQTKEYRLRYPQKGLLHQINANRQHSWAFLMGGGSMLLRYLQYAGATDPQDYMAPEDAAIIQPTYDFIRSRLSGNLHKMVPLDLIRNPSGHNWCLGQPGVMYLVYALQGGPITLDLSAARGAFQATWFDPRTGSLREDSPRAAVAGGRDVTFVAPEGEDWVLWLAEVSSGKSNG